MKISKTGIFIYSFLVEFQLLDELQFDTGGNGDILSEQLH